MRLRLSARVMVAMAAFAIAGSMFVVAAPSASAGPCWPDPDEIRLAKYEAYEKQRSEASALDRWYSDRAEPLRDWLGDQLSKCGLERRFQPFPKVTFGAGVAVIGLMMVRTRRGSRQESSADGDGPDSEHALI